MRRCGTFAEFENCFSASKPTLIGGNGLCGIMGPATIGGTGGAKGETGFSGSATGFSGGGIFCHFRFFFGPRALLRISRALRIESSRFIRMQLSQKGQTPRPALFQPPIAPCRPIACECGMHVQFMRIWPLWTRTHHFRLPGVLKLNFATFISRRKFCAFPLGLLVLRRPNVALCPVSVDHRASLSTLATFWLPSHSQGRRHRLLMRMPSRLHLPYVPGDRLLRFAFL